MRGRRWVCLAVAGVALACTNNPYPDGDDAVKVRYRSLPGSPKTLDPAVAYSTLEHAITANVYETLLEYHYLKRPYTLIPGLATQVPTARPLPDGRVSYTFQLREGMLYQEDESFELGVAGRTTRAIVAADVAFELQRIADPAVTSPVVTTFAKIDGFSDFSRRLKELRESDPSFAEQRIDRQYAAAGGIEGVRVHGDRELEIVLSAPYPQLLYWFAMPFTAPVPWEAVEHYDGEEGRDFFREHPISTGPFRIDRYDKESRIVLARNENWYGALHPQQRAPGAVYPDEGEPEDAARGLLDPAYMGRKLPFLERVEFRLEKEQIPLFNKFLQGYYDASGVIRESFDTVILEGGLSPQMQALGVQLVKSVDPAVFYIGFNMNDAVVGTPAGARGRLLRQAMSLAVDAVEYHRIFNNGRGVPAQSPLPPGIFGYEKGYANPFRTPDLERAGRLLEEAGYPGGVDPETGRPLELSFDLGNTDTRARLQFQFFVDSWKRLGLDVSLNATNYNEFREKMRRGAYQIFTWGWVADYPDPENFLFLLWSEMATAKNPGAPNAANFSDPRYDELFLRMRDIENGDERMALIREMRSILERERPWIELTHPESYALYHEWMKNVKPAGISSPTAKYVDIDPAVRATRREDWNRPILWPAYGLGFAAIALVIPGIVTFLRERQ